MAVLTSMDRQRGFSLVELMVAVTIGLIILAAVSGIFVTSKTTYNTQDNLARLQENARFAIHYLADDVRKAGYSGCLESVVNTQINLNNPTAFNFNAKIALEGMDNTASGNWFPSSTVLTPTNLRPGTDAITMRSATSSGISITKYMPPTSAELNISAMPTGMFSDGDILMVSNCTNADIIQITNVQLSSLKLQHAPGVAVSGNPSIPGNQTPHELSSGYGSGPPPAQVMKFTSRIYYVMNRANPDGSTTPVLVRQDNGGALQELIEGVENMQIVYGIDTDPTADGAPNLYVRANQVSGLAITAPDGQAIDPWTRVSTVQFGLVIRTLGNNEQYVDNAPLTITGFRDTSGTADEVNPAAGDRNQRRLFTFSVNPRNL